MEWTRRELTASDGIRLAYYTGGNPGGPTILLVHGYPDDHLVWNPLAERLSDQFDLLAYDVRGAGASTQPAARSGYQIDQLAADLAMVADTAGWPVHVIAHDWGSIQSWRAVTQADAAQRYASFTSISGPDLAMAGAWFGRVRRNDRRAAVKQLASSWYLLMFQLPLLPELFWRSGLGFRSIGRRDATLADRRNALTGLNLYRANLGRSTAHRPRRCEVPTLVLAPRFDQFVGIAMQTEAPARFTSSLRTEIVDGGHWVVQHHPERVASILSEFVTSRS